jgi:PKD repeat protein
MKAIKQFSVLMSGLAMAASALVLNSCSKDDEPAKPTASFNYEATGRSVTFANTSKNAKTYTWNFGDTKTSTEQNPTHEYATYGNYTVTLSVTGDGGVATSLPDALILAKTSKVVIDGTFSDWADVPVNSSLGAGTLTKVKVDYDASKVYFYVEGTSDMQGFFDLYLNVDNDSSTAFSTAHWPLGLGSEFLIEGNLAVDHDAPMFGFDFSNNDNWKFDFNVEAPVLNTGAGYLASSDLKTVGNGKGIEFSLTRASLSGLSNQGFTFGLEDILNWSPAGSVPAAQLETSKSSFVDLTK